MISGEIMYYNGREGAEKRMKELKSSILENISGGSGAETEPEDDSRTAKPVIEKTAGHGKKTPGGNEDIFNRGGQGPIQ